MLTVLVLPTTGLRLPAISDLASAKSIVLERAIADGSFAYTSKGRLGLYSDANRKGRPRKSFYSDHNIARDADKLKGSRTSDGEKSRSSRKEEIMALFRRIQSSISRGGSTGSRRRTTKDLNQKQLAESFRGALRQFPARKQVAVPEVGTFSMLIDKDLKPEVSETSSQRRGHPEVRSIEHAPITEDPRVSRPMSNFVKRLPIPLTLSTKLSVEEAPQGPLPLPATADELLHLQKIEAMKLHGLKELARTKGLKGYSKLKKAELLELLKGLLASSK